MSRTLLIAALVLGVGLSAAFAQERREKTRTRTVEKSADRPSAVRPSPAPIAETTGAPERPADGRAPLVSVQMVMADAITESAAKHERPSPQSSGSAKGAAAIGALDLSAPDERLLEELRKVGIQGRVDVLYRINLTTADQQKSTFQLSHRLPRIVGMTLTQFGQTNNIDMLNTGLIVEIQPRVAGEIVSLTVSLEDSRLGLPEEGVPVSIPAKGETTRAQPIHNFSLRTAVNVPSGQTIVLSGLVSEDGPRKRQMMILLCPRIIALK